MSKITAYNSFTTVAENDLLVGVDVSDTTMASTGTDKKITYSQLNAVDWINVVTQYGADPTGVADSTTAIQSALTAARTSTYGGTVYFPAGLYIISNMLQVGSNTTLLGPGMNLCTIRMSSGSWSSVSQVGGINGLGIVITYNNSSASYITMQGITFDGNETGVTDLPSWASGSPNCCGGIHTNSVTNLTINECQIINTIGYTVYLQLCSNFEVTNCVVTSGQVSSAQGWGTPAQQDGIHMDGCNYGVISGNTIDTGTSGGVGDDAIALQALSGPCHDYTISGNNVRTAAGGVDLALGSVGANYSIYNVSITGNNFWWCYTTGVVCQVFESSTGPATAYNVSVTGNVFSQWGGSGDACIKMIDYPAGVGTAGHSWSAWTIEGNTFNNPQSSGQRTMYIIGGSDLTVANNVLSNLGTEAYCSIQIGDYDNTNSLTQGVSNCSVTGNVVDMGASTNSSGQLGIVFVESSNSVIANNTIIGSGTTGTYGFAVYLSAVTGCTGITVSGNTCYNWKATNSGSAILGEVSQGAFPDYNSFINNTLRNCSGTMYAIAGSHTTSQMNPIDVQVVPDTESYQYSVGYTTGGGTTSLQKLFNLSTAGAITLPVGLYFFECAFSLSAMSASSGTFSFGFGGTATVGGIQYTALASKTALTPSTAQITTSTTAAATALVTASTTTTGSAIVKGSLYVTGAGSIIPSFATSVAAASVVGAFSYFRTWFAVPVNSPGWTLGYAGPWS